MQVAARQFKGNVGFTQSGKSPQLMRGPLGRNMYDRSSTNLFATQQSLGATDGNGCRCSLRSPPKTGAITCSGWHLQSASEIEIWRGSQAITLHGVHVLEDSISGVPLWQRPECDSCRIAVSLETVDSLRMVDTERSWMILAGLPFAALGAVVVTWRLFRGGD
jgi:hypothetical protein